MKPYFAMGLFALYVVVVSLVRVLPDREFPRLTAMKKAWGRLHGLALHFVTNVGLPLVLGIIFLGHGISNFPSLVEHGLISPIHHGDSLPYLHYRQPGPIPHPSEVAASGEIALLLSPPQISLRARPEPPVQFGFPLAP